MKLFLTKSSLYFLSAVLFFGIPSVYKNKYLLFQDNDLYYPLEFDKAFRRSLQKPNIILGNSRALSSIDSSLIEKLSNSKFYHLGYRTSSLKNAYYTLQAFLVRNSEVENVILEVSWFSFNNSRLNTRYKHLIDLFPYVECKYSFLQNVPTFFYIDFTSHYYSSLFERNLGGYSKNYSSRFKTSKNSTNTPRVKIQKFYNLFPKGIAGVNEEYFQYYQKIIQLTVKKNVNLILFTSPETKEYVDLQRDRNSILDIYSSSARKYDNVHYFNFAPYGEYYNKKNHYIFSDSHHLSNPTAFTYDFYEKTKDSFKSKR